MSEIEQKVGEGDFVSFTLPESTVSVEVDMDALPIVGGYVYKREFNFFGTSAKWRKCYAQIEFTPTEARLYYLPNAKPRIKRREFSTMQIYERVKSQRFKEIESSKFSPLNEILSVGDASDESTSSAAEHSPRLFAFQLEMPPPIPANNSITIQLVKTVNLSTPKITLAAESAEEAKQWKESLAMIVDQIQKAKQN